MPINALIIDDERLARAELKRLLAPHDKINLVGEAENIQQAFELIQESKPDLLFLDIEMPGGTGIELADALASGDCSAPSPKIVFCTAYDEFAVDAFALNAVDYLVKPVNPKRLASCVERLLSDDTQKLVADYLNDDFKLMVKFQERMKIIRLDDIFRFESIGNHAALHTKHGKAYLQSSLNKIEARLNPANFFRASRAELLRLDAIDSLEPTIGYGLTASLCNGQEVEISRRQASRLKELFSVSVF